MIETTQFHLPFSYSVPAKPPPLRAEDLPTEMTRLRMEVAILRAKMERLGVILETAAMLIDAHAENQENR
jgi:hypothetical protein